MLVATWPGQSAAATIIQSAFRHHVKRMMWQRADELVSTHHTLAHTPASA